VKLLLNWL